MRNVVMTVLVGAIAGGCSNLAGPNYCNPGPQRYQQTRATEYDPFPEPELGPEVEGARPREFQEPRTQISPERRPPPPF